MTSKFNHLYEHVVAGKTLKNLPVRYTLPDELTPDRSAALIHFLETNTLLADRLRSLERCALTDKQWDDFWQEVQQTAETRGELEDFTTSGIWKVIRDYYVNRIAPGKLTDAEMLSGEVEDPEKGTFKTFLKAYDDTMKKATPDNKVSFTAWQSQPQYHFGSKMSPLKAAKKK